MPGGAYAVPPALAPLVSSIGYLEGRFAHARELALPSGNAQLLINLDRDELHTWEVTGAGGRRTRGAALMGPTTTPVVIDPAEQRRIMWVAFRPGGAYPFFAPDATALRDQLVDLADLWGGAAVALRDRLLATDRPAGRLRILEAALLTHASRAPRPDPALAVAAVALHRGSTVAQAADRLGWTRRRLDRRFAEQLGMAPKRFARVRRFQRLLRATTGAADRDWARLAVECGYHDQAHLIHEFRAHAATTPGRYAPRSPDAVNHAVTGFYNRPPAG
jgi:AraC-like DNA-binding protein